MSCRFPEREVREKKNETDEEKAETLIWFWDKNLTAKS